MKFKQTVMNILRPITLIPLLMVIITNIVFAASVTLILTFGSCGSGEGEFDGASDIELDSVGNIYVADTENKRIQKFDSNGNFIFEFITNHTDGLFDGPTDLGLESSGNIYVADALNRLIQKFDSSGNFIFEFGTQGSDDGEFGFPSAIALDSSGNIYVTDSNNDIHAQENNRVQVFDSNGNFIFKFGAKGSGDGEFMGPLDIELDNSGNIYVADSANHRIQKFDSNGNFIFKFGSNGTGDGEFMFPADIALDSSGNIYVADANNNRIQIFDLNGNFLFKFGSSDENARIQIVSPNGVAVDSSGNVYVVESDRVQVFSVALGGAGAGAGGGCSVAPIGPASSIPVFLFIPLVIAAVRIGLGRCQRKFRKPMRRLNV